MKATALIAAVASAQARKKASKSGSSDDGDEDPPSEDATLPHAGKTHLLLDGEVPLDQAASGRTPQPGPTKPDGSFDPYRGRGLWGDEHKLGFCSFPHSPTKATDWLLYRMNHNCEPEIQKLQDLRRVTPWFSPLDWADVQVWTISQWYELVRTNGPLDFKKDQQRVWKWLQPADHPLPLGGVSLRGDMLANIYYGYAGRKAGFPSWLLQAGAGAYNGWEHAKIRIPNWNSLSWRQRLVQLFKQWPWEWWSTWFDNPADNAAIRSGIELYQLCAAQGKPVTGSALRDILEKYSEEVPEMKLQTIGEPEQTP